MTVESPQELLGELRRYQLLTAVNLGDVERDLDQFSSAIRLAENLVLRGWLTRFQCEQLLAGNGSQLVLGPYRVQEKLGEGGMGVVVKAWSQQHNRVVALKLLRLEGAGSQATELLKRFAREAAAIARLKHPNVVTRYEYDVIDGTHYIAMEYVEGVDLEKMVRQQGVLGYAQAINYVRQAALGLQHAHEQGLVHRDIKPGNLLVTRATSSMLQLPRLATPLPGALKRPDTTLVASGGPGATHPFGVVKILDMGLARIGQTSDEPAFTAITRQGALLGTPDYMAPEQANDASAVDIRADLYSLGCTLYYLLTGRPPFPDGTALEKIVKHQSLQPLAVEAIRPGTPPGLCAIVRRLLAKRLEERFQTPHDLVDALDALALPDDPLTAPPPPPTASVSVPTVVEAAGRADRAPTRNETPTRYQPPRAAELIHRARSLGTVPGHQGFVTALAFAPDNKMLATGGLDDCIRLWSIRGPRVQEMVALRRELGEVTAIAFAPHEPYLISGSSELSGHMWRWDWRAKGEGERTPVPDEPARIDALAFAPNGKLLAGSSANLVHTWTVNGRDLRRRADLRGHAARVKCLAYSPNGKFLASGSEQAEVFLWEFGWLRVTPRPLTGHEDAVLTLAFAPDGRTLATGSADGTVRLWDMTAAGSPPPAILTGHDHKVRDLRFTASGRALVSAGDGGQVFLWDVAGRTKLRQWQLDVRSMAVSMTLSSVGRLVAVGGSDGTVSVFDLDPSAGA